MIQKLHREYVSLKHVKYIAKNIIKCEPFMSKRKLYRNLSKKDLYDEKSQNTRMNLIAFSDCKRNIFEIAKELNVPLSKILKEYKLLKKFKILK